MRKELLLLGYGIDGWMDGWMNKEKDKFKIQNSKVARHVSYVVACVFLDSLNILNSEHHTLRRKVRGEWVWVCYALCEGISKFGGSVSQIYIISDDLSSCLGFDVPGYVAFSSL